LQKGDRCGIQANKYIYAYDVTKDAIINGYAYDVTKDAIINGFRLVEILFIKLLILIVIWLIIIIMSNQY
jgi:hypothetical protein